MADIKEIEKKLNPSNKSHQIILKSLQNTLKLYERLVNEVDQKDKLNESTELILNSINTNNEFNNDMLNTKNRRGIPRGSMFKINAVRAATRVAQNTEDFTRIEIVPVNSKSDAALKAIFIARNIDGVIEASVDNIMSLTKSSNIKDAIAGLQNKGEFEKTIETDLEKLHKNLKTQLEKGIGSRYQLLNYNREKIREIMDKIVDAKISGKTNEEISKLYNISTYALNDLSKDINKEKDLKIIDSSKAKIKKLVDDRKTFGEIAKELNVDPNRISSYCRENGLKIYNENDHIKNEIESIEKKLKNGITFKEIASEMNVNETRLKNICIDNNLDEKKEENSEKKAS